MQCGDNLTQGEVNHFHNASRFCEQIWLCMVGICAITSSQATFNHHICNIGIAAFSAQAQPPTIGFLLKILATAQPCLWFTPEDFASTFLDEDAIEGSSLAPAGSIQLRLKYHDFENYEWQVRP